MPDGGQSQSVCDNYPVSEVSDAAAGPSQTLCPLPLSLATYKRIRSIFFWGVNPDRSADCLLPRVKPSGDHGRGVGRGPWLGRLNAAAEQGWRLRRPALLRLACDFGDKLPRAL